MKFVLLPGLDGTGRFMAAFETALIHVEPALCPSDIVRVTYPDHVTDYPSAIAHTKAHLPEGDFTLIAESFSGPVAIALAADKPPKLKAVVFVATFAKSPGVIPPPLAHLVRLVPYGSSMVAKIAMPFFMGRWRSDGFTKQFTQVMGGIAPKTVASWLKAVFALDGSVDLVQIDVPTLYLQASDDRLVPAQALKSFEETLSDLKVNTVEGSHFLLQARPDICAAAIRSFVKPLV